MLANGFNSSKKSFSLPSLKAYLPLLTLVTLVREFRHVEKHGALFYSKLFFQRSIALFGSEVRALGEVQDVRASFSQGHEGDEIFKW